MSNLKEIPNSDNSEIEDSLDNMTKKGEEGEKAEKPEGVGMAQPPNMWSEEDTAVVQFESNRAAILGGFIGVPDNEENVNADDGDESLQVPSASKDDNAANPTTAVASIDEIPSGPSLPLLDEDTSSSVVSVTRAASSMFGIPPGPGLSMPLLD